MDIKIRIRKKLPINLRKQMSSVDKCRGSQSFLFYTDKLVMSTLIIKRLIEQKAVPSCVIKVKSITKCIVLFP